MVEIHDVVDIENNQRKRDTLRRKLRKEHRKSLIVKLLTEFADKTTLHGLKYVIERGISIVENMFWLLTFLVSIGLCTYLMRNIYIKWRTSPVIVSFSEKMEHVANVPFPSITICPQLKLKKSIYDYKTNHKFMFHELNNKSKITEVNLAERITFCDSGMLCDLSVYDRAYNFIPPEMFFTIDEIEIYENKSDVVKLLQDGSPTIDEVFEDCLWRGNKRLECTELFTKVLTSEGICFNFNMLSSNEMFFENSIQKHFPYTEAKMRSSGWSLGGNIIDEDNNTIIYPRKGSENAGIPDLFVILMDNSSERDGYCNSLNKGFKIYLQHPSDMPQSSLYYYAAINGQVSSMAIKFSKKQTAEALEKYSPEVRQCHFPKDGSLKYFRIYTQQNCQLECASNYTFQKCDCVWFHLPTNDSRNVCSALKSECVYKAKDEIATRAHLNTSDTKSFDKNMCHCLPSCNSMTYDAEILKTEFQYSNWLEYMMSKFSLSYEPMNGIDHSALEFYFKEPRFVTIRRSELFGITDFLANVGGLLGLFLGFSFLSLVEIIYFSTLRLCCLMKRDKKEN